MARARTLVLNTKVNVTGADQLRGLGRTLQKTGGLLTAGLTLPLVGFGAAMLTAAQDAERAQAKLTNVFDSMGAASFTTVEALNKQAEAIQAATTFDDESITEAQAVLLTFGKVTGDVFTRGIEAATDMTALFEGDLQTATIQVGKALNDPIKGITALAKAGVSFTEQQKEQIKTLTRSGDVLGAQTIILSELERQFGGTAEALAGTAGGQMTQALNQLNDAAEEFGAILAPVLVDVANGLKGFAKWLRQLNPETKEWALRIGLLVAALGPALFVVGTLVRTFGVLKVAGLGLVRIAPLIGASFHAMLGPIGLVTGAIALLAAAFATDFMGTRSNAEQSIDNIAMNFGTMGDTVHRIADELGVDFGELKNTIQDAMEESGTSFDEVVERIDAGLSATGEALAQSSSVAHEWSEDQKAAYAAMNGGVSDALYGPGGVVPLVEGLPEDVQAPLDVAKAAFDKAFEDVGAGMIASIAEVPAGIEVVLSNGETIVGTSADTMMGAVSAAIQRAEADALIAASGIPGAIGKALTDNADEFQGALDLLVGMMNGSVDVMVDDAEIGAAKAALAQAEAYIAANPETAAAINSQMRVVQDILDEAAIQAKITAGLSGHATIEEQARAMALSAWLVEQEALGIVNLQEDQWERAIEIAREKGYDTPAEFAQAMRQANREVVTAADLVRRTVTEPLENLPSYKWGSNVVGQFAAGMEAGLVRVRQAAVAVGSATGGQIRIESEPPDHSSPLYGITKWGGNLVKTYADGITSSLGLAQRAGLMLAGTVALGSGSGIKVSGAVSALSSAAAPGSHVTNNFYLQWDGEPPKGRSEGEIIGNLQRLSPLLEGGVF